MSLSSYECVIDEQQKAGDNLEYDDLYLQMEDLATSSEAALAAVDGDEADGGGGGKQADYKALLKATSSLLERTRDFRVATFHTIALTATHGFQGLLSGLNLLQYLSAELWEEAYPQLDPDDDLDPTERLNILSALSPNSINDPYNFLTVLINQRLCPPLPITSRDIKIAKGIISTDADSDIVLLKGQVLSLPDPAYADSYQFLSRCQQAVIDLEQTVNAQLTDGSVLSLEKLSNELSFILHFLDEARGRPMVAESAPQATLAVSAVSAVSVDVVATGVASAVNAVNAANVMAGSAVAGMAAGAGAANVQGPLAQVQGAALSAQASNGQVPAAQGAAVGAVEPMVPMSAYTQLQMQVQQLQAQLQAQAAMPAKVDVPSLVIESRKDALALIEKCRAYFQKKEPTSPVPFLLQRALNMADMNFIQLLGEIDSSALERGREQLGVKDTSED